MLELVIRLVFSLAVVLGLLILVARVGAKRFRGATGALVHVVHRQPLSRGASIAVVTVGSRVLVLGATEQQVQLLTELDPEELEGIGVPDDISELEVLEGGSSAGTGASTGPLAGSVLSAQTWKQALAAATRRDRAAS